MHVCTAIYSLQRQVLCEQNNTNKNDFSQGYKERIRIAQS